MNYYNQVKEQRWKKGDLIRTEYGLCLATKVDLNLKKRREPYNTVTMKDGAWREVMNWKDGWKWEWAIVEVKVLAPSPANFNWKVPSRTLTPGQRIAFWIHPTRTQIPETREFRKVGC